MRVIHFCFAGRQGAFMLVFSRRLGEGIVIGEQITITVVKISGNAVRIGVEAPRESSVERGEQASASPNPPSSPLPPAPNQ